MNRKRLATLILEKIQENKDSIKQSYQKSENQIGYFVIDNLLPNDIAEQIYNAFPKPESMTLRKSLREFKYIAAQMNNYDPILEEAIYAFQDERIVELIKNICDLETLYPDENLYAGGISLMGKDQFLNPHLDNSHEVERKQWRVLNLLYYTTPKWIHENGGNLEIWTHGMKHEPITVVSKFNRLAIMATHGYSWHSVSPILTNAYRTCVSNYYFSDTALKKDDTFHVTSFRGRPEQKIRDITLQADTLIRQSIRKLFPKGVVKTDHLYKK